MALDVKSTPLSNGIRYAQRMKYVINGIWILRVHVWKGQWHKENRKSSSETRHWRKLHVRMLELNLETQCHETRQAMTNYDSNESRIWNTDK